MTWYRKAAEQELSLAQYNLGNMYAKGRGIMKDEAQAVEWYRKAAEQGYADAQANLGNMYNEGKGVIKDEVQAIAWYRKAAEQGLSLAQFNLGNMYLQGKGVAQDEAQAVAWYRKAAEQGYADAENVLGQLESHKVTDQKNTSEQIPLQQPEGYTAIISCAFQWGATQVGICFQQSELKITKDNRSKIYSMSTLNDAGKIDNNVLYVELPKHFKLMAKNSQQSSLLDVIIIDSKGNVLFEDQAGVYDYITIRN